MQRHEEDHLKREEREQVKGQNPTPLETRKDAEAVPSTTTDIKRLDKRLEMSLQKEEVTP